MILLGPWYIDEWLVIMFLATIYLTSTEKLHGYLLNWLNGKNFCMNDLHRYTTVFCIRYDLAEFHVKIFELNKQVDFQ